ncbi:MAG: hypothetical protein Q8O00_12415, partial [Holophaga sp.]|nr:hypothetical protein [Holophaga sp.]
AFVTSQLPSLQAAAEPFVQGGSANGQNGNATASFTLSATSRQATFGVLLRPTKAFQGKTDPAVTLTVDGQIAKAERVDAKGVWGWYTLAVNPGTHRVELTIAPGKDAKGVIANDWSGSAQFWITGTQAVKPIEAKVKGKLAAEPRLLPPTGRGDSELPRTVKLGEVSLQITK